MKKNFRITILTVVFLFTFIMIFLFEISHQHSIDQKAQVPKEQSGYYIMDRDGYITVYEADKTTVFEYSTIQTNQLPYQVQLQVKEGMKAENLEQVYGFLENYSS